jgi:hypothetical protein
MQVHPAFFIPHWFFSIRTTEPRIRMDHDETKSGECQCGHHSSEHAFAGDESRCFGDARDCLCSAFELAARCVCGHVEADHGAYGLCLADAECLCLHYSPYAVGLDAPLSVRLSPLAYELSGAA